ncbi:MAG: hypothetical protein HYY48_06840 [Gammaproteobacteria bacterium]|nr:hypothetical protein [Gammaproteobacteria bacterium]
MKRLAMVLLVPALALGAISPSAAETAYVTAQIRTGLHEEKSLDSPITKLVSTGTVLEIIKREDSLSFVRDPDGASGWIDSSYLSTDTPTPSGQLKEALEHGDVLERRLAEAQQQIATLSAGRPAPVMESQRYETLRKQYEDLEQQLKRERLNSGELEAQLAELKKRLGVNNDNASLYGRIQELESEKKRLEVMLADGAGDGAVGAAADPGAPAAAGVTLPWGNLATGLAVALIAGWLGGIYLMDYLNRRRHGGFRV